ncbi:MAG: hypothetical protein RLZZ232_1639 [Planctomycetota bacterium]
MGGLSEGYGTAGAGWMAASGLVVAYGLMLAYGETGFCGLVESPQHSAEIGGDWWMKQPQSGARQRGLFGPMSRWFLLRRSHSSNTEGTRFRG